MRNDQVMGSSTMQSLFDSINESGLEWPMNLFDPGSDYGMGWEG